MDKLLRIPVLRRTLATLLALLLLLVLLPSAQAHERDEHGVVTVHDTEQGPAADPVGGSVDCLFWVKATGLTHPHGTMLAFSAGSFGARTQEYGAWEATPNGDGTYSLEVGPLNITESGDRWEIILQMYDETGAYHDTRSESFGYGYCGQGDDEVTGPEHGVITARDDAQGLPSATLHCSFWVHGEGMRLDHGRLVAWNDEADDPDSPVHLGAWTGEPDGEGGYAFTAGPFTFNVSGEWHIFAEVGEGNFTDTLTVAYVACGATPDEPDPVLPECPSDVRVEATSDGNRLAWSHGGGSGTFRVYRDGVLIAELPADARAHLDEDVEAGVTYAYVVTFDDGTGESEACATVEVTAVPFFGSPLLGALALVAALGAFVWMRRRT